MIELLAYPQATGDRFLMLIRFEFDQSFQAHLPLEFEELISKMNSAENASKVGTNYTTFVESAVEFV